MKTLVQIETVIVNVNAKKPWAHDQISHEKIIDASFALLGYISTSKSSRSEIYRQLWRNFSLMFAWAKKRSSNLSEKVFKEIIQSNKFSL